MKKAILTGVLLLNSFSIINAQELGKNEINVAWSDNSTLTFSNLFSNALVNLLSGYSSTNERSTGLFSVGYLYAITERLRVGGDIGYADYSSDIEYNKNGQKESVGKRKIKYIMVLPTAKYSYLKKGMFDFYGSASAGVAFSESKDNYIYSSATKTNDVNFAWQLNPVGLRVGKQLGGYVEGGFGYKGFVSVGVDYKF